MSLTDSITETMTEDVVEVRTTDTPEDAAHIVRLPRDQDGKTTAQAYIMQARIEGFEVEALCGYRWIPQKDPKVLPVCETCLEIYKHDPNGYGDRDRLPDA